MNIILIESESGLNETVSVFLKKEGYYVYSYFNLKNFFNSIYDYSDIDLIIAEIYLPDGNFLEEMKKYPEIVKKTKIIIISAQTEINNIKKSFKLGADDFIKKPFECEEILLRIDKIFNKSTNKIKITDTVYYNPDAKSINCNETETILSKKEAALLELFLKNRGKFLDKTYIMEKIWQKTIPNNTLSVLIKRVREKIGEKNVIVSKRELGYIMF